MYYQSKQLQQQQSQLQQSSEEEKEDNSIPSTFKYETLLPEQSYILYLFNICF